MLQKNIKKIIRIYQIIRIRHTKLYVSIHGALRRKYVI